MALSSNQISNFNQTTDVSLDLNKLSLKDAPDNTMKKFLDAVDAAIASSQENNLKLAADSSIKEKHKLLINGNFIRNLYVKTVKLSVGEVLHNVPINKLINLFAILENNIDLGDSLLKKYVENFNKTCEVESVITAANACLLIIVAMTSPKMPKRIYLEDTIRKLALFTNKLSAFLKLNEYDKKYYSEYHLEVVLGKNFYYLSKKLEDLLSGFADLFRLQSLCQDIISTALDASIQCIFTENDNLLGGSLKLILVICERYESLHEVLFEEIILNASERETKRNISFFSKDYIHVFSAVILELLQSFAVLKTNELNCKKVKIENNICTIYHRIVKISEVFLTIFLNKIFCDLKEERFTYLLESFVGDILMTSIKPEWPASGLLLNLLLKLLLNHVNHSESIVEQRVFCLRLLTKIFEHLLKFCKVIKVEEIETILKKKMEELSQFKGSCDVNLFQKALLDFVIDHSKNDQLVRSAFWFYMVYWYTDCVKKQSLNDQKKINDYEDKKKNNYSKKSNTKNINEEELLSNEDKNNNSLLSLKSVLVEKMFIFDEVILDTSSNKTNLKYETAQLIVQYLLQKSYPEDLLEQQIDTILLLLKEPSNVIKIKAIKTIGSLLNTDYSLMEKDDIFKGINNALSDRSSSVRDTAAEVFGNFILNKPESMNRFYSILFSRILDTSILVRKRIIKFFKDYCLQNPHYHKISEICTQIIKRYDDENERKLVLEVFVALFFTFSSNKNDLNRKVLILLDILKSLKGINYKFFENVLVGLVNYKGEFKVGHIVSIKKTFQQYVDYFVDAIHPFSLIVDSLNFNDVSSVEAFGLSCQQATLKTMKTVGATPEKIKRITKTHFDAVRLPKSPVKINTVDIKENSEENVEAICTALYFFVKAQPQSITSHLHKLKHWLSLKSTANITNIMITTAVDIFELSLSVIKPDLVLFTQIEESIFSLISLRNKLIVKKCLSYLGLLVNNHTKNFHSIMECFNKFQANLKQFKQGIELKRLNGNFDSKRYISIFERSFFIIGMIIENFKLEEIFKNNDIKQEIFELSLWFLKEDEDVKIVVLTTLKLICKRYSNFIFNEELKHFYQNTLKSKEESAAVKAEVLKNIEAFLVAEDNRVFKQKLNWKSVNLKDYDEIGVDKNSLLVEYYLDALFCTYFSPDLVLRQPALQIIKLILTQGLVHPIIIVPYLICISTDPDAYLAQTADKHLSEIDMRYRGFIQMKSTAGIKLSFELQKVIQAQPRGFRIEGTNYIALHGHLYNVLRKTKQQRRAMVANMLKPFDEEISNLSYLLYLADNIACFEYQLFDEVLFIIHQIDLTVLLGGKNILQRFREGLIKEEDSKINSDMVKVMEVKEFVSVENSNVATEYLNENKTNATETPVKSNTINSLLKILPEDTENLQRCMVNTLRYILLFELKNHLRNIFDITEEMIRIYTPLSNNRVFDKKVVRKKGVKFDPVFILNKLNAKETSGVLNEKGRKNLLKEYLNFEKILCILENDDFLEDDDLILSSENSGIFEGAHENKFERQSSVQTRNSTKVQISVQMQRTPETNLQNFTKLPTTDKIKTPQGTKNKNTPTSQITPAKRKLNFNSTDVLTTPKKQNKTDTSDVRKRKSLYEKNIYDCHFDDEENDPVLKY